MIIAQISDTHIDLENPLGEERIRNLVRCVDDINELDPLPDVVVHTGDLSNTGSPAEYEQAKKILGRLRPPVYVTAGNRDDRIALRAVFPDGRSLMPDTSFVQYVVNDFPVRLIILDTLTENTNKGDFCAPRADSLSVALADDAAKPTALFMHHPPFEVVESKYPIQFESLDAMARMEQAVTRQGNVIHAFCGHTHRDTGGRMGKVPVSSTPSVAVDLRLGEFPEGMQTVPFYQVHRFDGTRGFVSETRPAA